MSLDEKQRKKRMNKDLDLTAEREQKTEKRRNRNMSERKSQANTHNSEAKSIQYGTHDLRVNPKKTKDLQYSTNQKDFDKNKKEVKK